MDSSFFVLGKEETRGSTQYVGKSLPQFKPSINRCDATSEEMEKLRPKKLHEKLKQVFLSNSPSVIRLLRVPV